MKKKKKTGNLGLPGGPVVKKTLPSNAGDSIPGQGARIPHASWPKKKKKRKHKPEAILYQVQKTFKKWSTSKKKKKRLRNLIPPVILGTFNLP